jgi:thioredoxin-like negative regulator of GroEL
VTESADKQQQITIAYQAGKEAFERGRYREAVQYLAKASALTVQQTPLGGEIRIWLVTAYQAAEQTPEAIALCRQLHHHPDLEIRKQSRRLLYILEAPKLNLRSDWLTQIPDLSRVADQAPKEFQGRSVTTSARLTRQQADPEPVDLSQVNTQDNQFLWIALLAIVLLIGGLVWLS